MRWRFMRRRRRLASTARFILLRDNMRRIDARFSRTCACGSKAYTYLIGWSKLGRFLHGSVDRNQTIKLLVFRVRKFCEPFDTMGLNSVTVGSEAEAW